MPNTQHTPGPWSTGGNRGTVIFGPGGISTSPVIAACQQHPQDEANACLIAAAPEMLQALEYAAEIIKTARRYFPKSIKNSDRFDLENTNAAISKAIHKAKGLA